MRTWVGTEPGIVLKDEAFEAGGRFSIDPDALFLFSSAQSTMMPGRIAIRTMRVETCFADDSYVRQTRARDKISNIFMEERVKEVENQRKGLSLSSLFVKPRPIWTAQAFYGYFGDAFVENTTMENADNLAWSYNVLNHAMQKMIEQPILTDPRCGIDKTTRGFMSDIVFHATKHSNIQTNVEAHNQEQLRYFTLVFEKDERVSVDVKVGNSLLLPVVIERIELLIR